MYDRKRKKECFASEILFIRADINYAELHFSDGRKMVVSRGLAYLDRLMPNRFDRLHRAILVKKGIYIIDHYGNITIEGIGAVGVVARRQKKNYENII